MALPHIECREEAEYLADKLTHKEMESEIDCATSLFGGPWNGDQVKELLDLLHTRNSRNQSARSRAAEIIKVLAASR
jgi:hypothetical protein